MPFSAISRRMPILALALCLCLSALPLTGRAIQTDDVKAHLDRGIALFNERRLDEAREEFLLVNKSEPDNATALSYIGLIALSRRRYQEALEPLEKAARLQPNQEDVHLNLGNVYDQLKRYQEAIHEFQAAAALDPKSSSAYYDLGAAYFEMNRLPQSLDAYKKAAALAPEDAEVQNNLGYVEEKMDRLPAAIGSYSRATRLAPDNRIYLLNLALAQQALARLVQKSSNPATRAAAATYWNGARISLARSVQLAPNDYSVRETYAEALSEMGRDAEALTQFEKTSQLKPEEYRPYYFLGKTRARLGDFKAAIAALQQALSISKNASKPDSIDALRLLGFAQFKQKQYTEAIKSYEQVVQSVPNDLASWTNLGLALQQQGDEAGALTALEEAIQRGGTGKQVAPLRRAVGYYYLRRGDPDSLKKAHEAYLQSTQSAPDSADGYNGLGLVAQKQGNIDEALTAFTRATVLDPRFADAFNNLGGIYEQKGDMVRAAASYRQALKIAPNHALARKNLDRIAKHE